MKEQVQYIQEEFQKIEIPLSDGQAEQFYTFYEMLVEKNRYMNLTGITEFSEVVRKHFIDSVYRVPLRGENIRVMDVGTGAGFPGIPLKILYPDIRITLLDSLQKRLGFIQETVDALGLRQVELLHGRAEDFGQNSAYREKYEYVCSRAVANLSSLCEYCIPFLKEKGIFIAYKSRAVEEELEQARTAIRMLGADEKNVKIDRFRLPGSDEERCLLQICKTGITGKKYPRRAGVPAKEPLGQA